MVPITGLRYGARKQGQIRVSYNPSDKSWAVSEGGLALQLLSIVMALPPNVMERGASEKPLLVLRRLLRSCRSGAVAGSLYSEDETMQMQLGKWHEQKGKCSRC